VRSADVTARDAIPVFEAFMVEAADFETLERRKSG